MEELGSMSFSQRIATLIKSNLIVTALITIGTICLVIGLIQYFSPSAPPIEFKSGEQVMSASTSAVTEEIVIDVSGEVESPGVYTLSSNSRLQDALTAAGGLSGKADRAYVSSSLNLASKLRDGIKIYIPAVGEEIKTSTPVNTLVDSGQVVASSGIPSINSATQAELEALPGVGPVTALKIINNRPYSALEELLSKKSVGKSLFEKIKDLISL